jgi:hypothetical protein
MGSILGERGLGEATVMDISSGLPLLGVGLGWVLGIFTQPLQGAFFGPKLVIDCERAPGKIGENADNRYMKFRVRNFRKRSIAKNCRPYIIAIHKVSSGKVISDNLRRDSAQLPWEGGGGDPNDYDPREIPFGASQYADIVHFSKKDDNDSGWLFTAKPGYIATDTELKDYRGTYRIEVLVAADGAKPVRKSIDINYNGHWKVEPHDA